ncbi:unnamed protein product [Urochloa humidicola]
MHRDTTFAALKGGVATSYQAVYAMARYEGDSSRGTAASASPRSCSASRSSAAAPLRPVYPHGMPHGRGMVAFL